MYLQEVPRTFQFATRHPKNRDTHACYGLLIDLFESYYIAMHLDALKSNAAGMGVGL